MLLIWRTPYQATAIWLMNAIGSLSVIVQPPDDTFPKASTRTRDHRPTGSPLDAREIRIGAVVPICSTRMTQFGEELCQLVLWNVRPRADLLSDLVEQSTLLRADPGTFCGETRLRFFFQRIPRKGLGLG